MFQQLTRRLFSPYNQRVKSLTYVFLTFFLYIYSVAVAVVVVIFLRTRLDFIEIFYEIKKFKNAKKECRECEKSKHESQTFQLKCRILENSKIILSPLSFESITSPFTLKFSLRNEEIFEVVLTS